MSQNTTVNSQYATSVKNLKIGHFTVGDNGCGAVEIHNAKVLKGIDSTLSETILSMQQNNGFIFGGALGTNPLSVQKILRKSGIRSTSVSLSEINKPGVYIIAFWNNDSIWDGAHYVALKYNGKRYRTYNNFSRHNPHDYATRYICGFYLG